MSDPDTPHDRWQTRLVQPRNFDSSSFRSLAPATYRGSTVIFDRLADAEDDWHGDRYTYGLYGTPTTRELAERIAELEGATRTVVTPGGQAAILLIYLAFCRTGSHALVPESAYGPNRELADDLLPGLGVEVEAYDPMIGAGIASLLRPNTALVWCESPGSITMEVQDVPAIATAAHVRGVTVAIDNTYAAGILFDAFGAGVDVSMQALTKYVGGHSDILLGSVSARSGEAVERIGATHRLLGLAASPDDCTLALRGLETLAVRLAHLEKATLAIARWCAARPEIEQVLHPALPECPGHDLWCRDFTGSASVFSIVMAAEWGVQRMTRFVEKLRLFRIGYSWGGTTSLVMTYPPLSRACRDYDERIIRLNIGFENETDLIDDLYQALEDVG